MAAGPQRIQLSKLCSSSDTFEKAQSILCLVNTMTRPGSGFVIKNPTAIPAICAYLASEQLNTGEVSLQSAMAAACVAKTEFTHILAKIRAALDAHQGNTGTTVTYEALVDAYHVHPRNEATACMEDAEAALPRADILKTCGANAVPCAIFYWVCQLIEEPSVRQHALCQTYAVQPGQLKAVLGLLEKQCDHIAEQIKFYLLSRQGRTQVPVSPASPQKSPRKATLRPRMTTPMTPATTPSKKRALASTLNAPFPETPTKKRRTNASSRANTSPAKHALAADTTAFHAALKGSPVKRSVGQESQSLDAGPSTPRRVRYAKVTDAMATPVQTNAQPSPSRSQGQTSPTRPPVRRRFRPVFLEQQQWCAQDPKVERMWAMADKVFGEMVGRHGNPFQRR